MTPVELAHIHAAAFVAGRGWTTAEFEELLAQPYTRLFAQVGGFALTRTLAGESELLTLAVDPAHQRRGIAHKLMTTWLYDAAAQADTAFLEVAADNIAALALYDRLAFQRSGLRKAYYTRSGGVTADAVLMTRAV